MLEKGRISCPQLFFILFNLVGATALIFLPAITAGAAGPDAWAAPLLATLPGIILIYILVTLGSKFPGQTIIQYIQVILGSWAGRTLGLLYIFFFIHTNSLILREFGELIVSLVMPMTPLVVFQAIMIFICAMAIRGGLEVIARTIQLTISQATILLIAMLLLGIPEMNFENLLPVFENGVKPILAASFAPIGWRGEVILLAMMLPYIAAGSKQSKRCALWAVVAIGITLSLDAVANTAVFGSLVPRMTFPTFSLVRQVSLFGFIERIDAVLMAIWVVGMFGKIVIFYYGAVLGAAQLINARDYKFLVFPLGVLQAAWSIMMVDNSRELVEYITKIWPLLAYIFEYLIPTLLLVVVMLLKKKSPKAFS